MSLYDYTFKIIVVYGENNNTMAFKNITIIIYYSVQNSCSSFCKTFNQRTSCLLLLIHSPHQVAVFIIQLDKYRSQKQQVKSQRLRITLIMTTFLTPLIHQNTSLILSAVTAEDVGLQRSLLVMTYSLSKNIVLAC